MAATKVKGVTLDTSELDRLTEETRPKARKIVNIFGLLVARDWAMGVRVDTSALRNGILAESQMTGDMTFTATDAVEYGIHQEFGTSRMAAWPALIPAIERWADRFYDAFKELFR